MYLEASDNAVEGYDREKPWGTWTGHWTRGLLAGRVPPAGLRTAPTDP